jgi:predicted N-acyltransferase
VLAATLAGIELDIIDRIGAVGADEWNGISGPDDPFMEHAFLAALEQSGSVGERAGAVPRFVLVRRRGQLVGAVPLYRKTNSYGEFIFDWSWAAAAQRAGIRYYPKLVAAVPFTPATGRRVLLDEGLAPAERRQAVARLVQGMRALADEERASSIHVLFCHAAEAQALAEHDLVPRLSLQFHWHNREGAAFHDFDDYLGTFKSRHRKQVRHERKVAAGHGLELATRTGPELDDRDWRALRSFYAANAERHGSYTYLTDEFFDVVRATYAHRVVATLAYRGGEPVAGTLNFEKGRHLYGRYWGCLGDYQMLHFELCYYRLIERAIAQGCTRFEAGAQGEHKLRRGLGPAFTHSAHWIRHPDLASAVTAFVASEADAVRQQALAYQQETPFRHESEGADGSGDGGEPAA